ncbi:Saccharopine dehydrogenase [Leucobacter sp. 7(1)]|nr:Saccharopine dehydrogenase [Leucobacter sp. 7(1)]
MHRLAGNHDLVVNTSGVEDVRLIQAAAPAAYLDVSATGRALAEMRAAAAPSQRVLLGAGLVPGLSTMLIAALPTVPGDSVDLAVILGTGEQHGPAAVTWTAGLAGQPVFQPPEGHPVLNFREHRMLPAERGIRRYLRADFPDHVLADPAQAITVRSYLAVGDRATTRALGWVGRVPKLAPLLARAPHWGDDRWSLIGVNRRTGAQISARGRGQSHATGVLAALGADALMRHADVAVHTMADLVPLGAVPDLSSR